MDKNDWASPSSTMRRASWPPRSRRDASWPTGTNRREPRLAIAAGEVDGAGSASIAGAPSPKVELAAVIDSYTRAILGWVVVPVAGAPETSAPTGDARARH